MTRYVKIRLNLYRYIPNIIYNLLLFGGFDIKYRLHPDLKGWKPDGPLQK